MPASTASQEIFAENKNTSELFTGAILWITMPNDTKLSFIGTNARDAFKKCFQHLECHTLREMSALTKRSLICPQGEDLKKENYLDPDEIIA